MKIKNKNWSYLNEVHMTDGNLKVYRVRFSSISCALILILTIIFWVTLNAIMQVDLHCKKLIEICCKVNKSEYINQQRLVFPNWSYESVSLDWPEKMIVWEITFMKKINFFFLVESKLHFKFFVHKVILSAYNRGKQIPILTTTTTTTP